MKNSMPLLSGWILLGCAATALAQAPGAVYPPAANLLPEGTPPVPIEIVQKASAYTEARDAHVESWNPLQRSMLIRTRFADVPGIHSLTAPMGARRQQTFLREPAREAHWQPVFGRYFVYMSDAGGNEQYQLYRHSADGRNTLLTDGTSRNMYSVMAQNGHGVAWASTHRNGADLDLWIEDLEHPETARLLAEWKGGGLQPQDWSSDGKTIAVLNYVSVNAASLSLVDVATGKVTALTNALDAGKAFSWEQARFAPDGKSLFALSDRASEFHQLWRIPLDGGQPVCLTPDTTQEIDSYAIAPGGKTIAYSVNQEGISHLHKLDVATGQQIPVPALPIGVVSNLTFHPQSGELAFSFSTPTQPNDVYTLPQGAAAFVRWTESETGGLDLRDEPEARLIHWDAQDRVRLSGFLFMPPARFTGKRPVIIDIHGGPEGQARPEYLDDYHQYHYFLREMGVALIYPNVRGSVGFGRTFNQLDNGIHREDSVTDIGALLDWIKTQPDLDASRVLVAGMSYGGYMTLSVATQYNDRIAASIDTVGLSNIITFLERTAEYRRQLRRTEYGDERDPALREALGKIAPANLAANLTKPMFILAGKKDPRVPYSESQQMAEAARKNQAPVWFLGMADEGHVFQKKPNIDYGFYLKILFVEKYLLATPQ